MRRFTLLMLLSSGLLIGVGCSSSKSEYKKTTELTKAPAAHDHGHGEKGPHGGSLVELGKEEYHAEIVVDHDAHALQVYVLGKDAKSAVPTSAKEVTLTPNGKDYSWTLKAAPQKTDGDGKSSLFELVDSEIVHGILDDKFIHGKLRVMIGDKPFLGDVDYHIEGEHKDHDDHKDHKDESDKAHKDAPKPDEKKDDAADKDKPKEPEAK